MNSFRTNVRRAFGALFLLLTSCTSATPATIYLPPTPISTATSTSIAGSSASFPSLTPFACTEHLTFLDDLTIPDYTSVAPGATLDKQWLVKNSGDCPWGPGYTLRFVGGSLLGAAERYALYPARPGAQATIRIVFKAPSQAGEYVSIWQAFTPDGRPFGEAFAIRIVVKP
ncbi:MAG: NBR1-Ig-like domain-containing protein [Anaerolineales bacterium]|nr:NBR1-Ig-like domain-containing protein [Anaerolineales bacterium]MDW8227570.1 NBR1-Ig-like domain-containing protein [Anaerolineales bacterium]